MRKCELYSHHELNEQDDDFFPEDIRRTTSHFELLGGIIGDNDEVSTFLKSKIDAITTEATKLNNCENPQYRMLLLRYCVSQKFTYLMRLTDPSYHLPDGASFSAHIDKLLRSCLLTLLGYLPQDTMPDEAWTQATLPFAHGGLGILDAPRTHHAAFVASSVECMADIDHLCNLSKRTAEREMETEQYAETHYQHLLDTTHSFTASDGHKYALPEFEDLLTFGGEQVQIGIVRVIQACRAHDIILAASQFMRTRLTFCADSGADMFKAIPKYTTPDLAFPPDGTAYLAATCIQLGLPVRFIVPRPCAGYNVGECYVHSDGFHLMSQCKKNNSRFRVHDKLRDELAVLIRLAGYHCVTESSEVLRSIDDQSQQRTDITVYGWSATGTLEIDVSVTDWRRLLQGGARTTAIHPYETPLHRERDKVQKYRASVEAAGSAFEPFVCEKEGLGVNAMKLVEHFVQKAIARTSLPYSLMKNYWTQRLTIAMRRTSMLCLQESALSFDRRSPTTVAETIDEMGIMDANYVSSNMLHSSVE